MPEVMVEMIAVVLEYVVVFGFDLEAGSASGGDFGDVVIGNERSRCSSIFLDGLTLGISYGQFAPVQHQGIVAVA